MRLRCRRRSRSWEDVSCVLDWVRVEGYKTQTTARLGVLLDEVEGALIWLDWEDEARGAEDMLMNWDDVSICVEGSVILCFISKLM